MGVLMDTVSSKEAREHFSDILNDVAYKGQKYTFTRNGKDMAVIVPVDEWNQIEKELHEFREKQLQKRLKLSIQQSKEGKVKSRGSFAKYSKE